MGSPTNQYYKDITGTIYLRKPYKHSRIIFSGCWMASTSLSNLQQESAITPNISAYAHVNRDQNFMHKPLSPLGCLVLAHENPYKRVSWSDHKIKAWNVGTSMEHHRAFNLNSKHTRSERIVNTLFFKHKYITSPIVAP